MNQIMISPQQTLLQASQPVWSLCGDEDFSALFAGLSDGNISVYKIKRDGFYSLNCTFKAHDSQIYCLQFNQQKCFLLSGSNDKTIKVWKVGSNGQCRLEQVLQSHSDKVVALYLSSLENKLFSGSFDKKLIIWSIDDSTNRYIEKDRIDDINNALWAVEYNQAHKKLFYGRKDNSIICQNFPSENGSNADTSVLLGHTNTVRTLFYCEHSETLFSGGHDFTIRIWKILNFGNFETIQVLKKHTDYVRCLQYEHSQKVLISASNDTSLLVWTLDSNNKFHCSKSFKIHENQIVKFLYIQSQRIIVSSSADKTIRFTRIDDGGGDGDDQMEIVEEAYGDIFQNKLRPGLKANVKSSRNINDKNDPITDILNTVRENKTSLTNEIKNTKEQFNLAFQDHFSKNQKIFKILKSKIVENKETIDKVNNNHAGLVSLISEMMETHKQEKSELKIQNKILQEQLTAQVY